MDPTTAGLVFLAAAIHPLRELFLKGNAHPEAAYFGVIVAWLGISGIHGLASGADFSSALAVWPEILIASLGLVLYYLGIVTAMTHGDLSVYYPIIRSAPVAIVTIGWLFLDHHYSGVLLLGVGLVTVGAFFLQYRPGAHPLENAIPLIASLLALLGMGIQSLADASAMRLMQPSVLLFWEYLIVAPICILYFSARKPPGASLTSHLFRGWQVTPGRYLAAAGTSYLSYYLILIAYQLGGNVAAVNGLRQISIPLSVVLAAIVLREAHLPKRFFWSIVLAFGVVIIILER